MAGKSRRLGLSNSRGRRNSSVLAARVLPWAFVHLWTPVEAAQTSVQQVLERCKYRSSTASSNYGPVDILFVLHVVIAQNPIPGLFNRRAFQHSWPDSSNKSDNVVVRFFGEGSRNVVKGANLFRIDLIDDLK